MLRTLNYVGNGLGSETETAEEPIRLRFFSKMMKSEGPTATAVDLIFFMAIVVVHCKIM